MSDNDERTVRQETSRLASLLMRKAGLEQVKRTMTNACGKYYIPDMTLDEMLRARDIMRTRLDEYLEHENRRLHALEQGKRIREWNADVDRRKHEKKMRKVRR